MCGGRASYVPALSVGFRCGMAPGLARTLVGPILASLPPFRRMPTSPGDQVSVHYAGRLDDGTPFDSSQGREPLSFTLGAGQVVAGFDDAVSGMEIGETKTVRLPADQAYGPRRDDLVMAVPRQSLPDGPEPEPGQRVQLGIQGGGTIEATIVDVTDDTLTFDANHALAGQALTFDLELVAIDS